MRIDLDRLERQALEGDKDARKAFSRERIRRGGVQEVRNLAWSLICGRPNTLLEHPVIHTVSRIYYWESAVEMLRDAPPSMGIVTLLEPLEVPLLWSPGRARILAADCVEYALPTFRSFFPEQNEDDRRLEGAVQQAVDAARAFARGEIDALQLGVKRDLIRRACLMITNPRTLPLSYTARTIAEAALKVCRAFPDQGRMAALLWSAAHGSVEVLPDPKGMVHWHQRRCLMYLFGQLEPDLKH